MPNQSSAERRQERRRVIAETILIARAPRGGDVAPQSVLRGIRRPDRERRPALSDIKPLQDWGTH